MPIDSAPTTKSASRADSRKLWDAFAATFVRPPDLGADAVLPVDDQAVYKPVLYSISTMLMFKAFANSMMIKARVNTVVKIHKGNTAKAAATLGRIQSLGAVLEFLVGPALGRLSDVYGRRFLMQLAPFSLFVSNALVLFTPYSVWVHYARVPTIAMDTSSFATVRAMMADVMSGRNIVENGFISMSAAGIGFLLAPVVAARLSTGSIIKLATFCYGMAFFVSRQMPETLPLRARRPLTSLDLKSSSPLASYQLFTNGFNMAMLSLVMAVQTLTDPRLMDDVAALVMRDKLKWNSNQIQRQFFFMNLSLNYGVLAGRFMVQRLGRFYHTHVAHLFKILAYMVWSRADGVWSMGFAQYLLVGGQRQRDGVETIITELAVQKGLGKGQVEAYKMNLRSVSNIVAPLVFARAFSIGKSKGNSALPFVVAVAFVAVSEAVLLLVRQSALVNELGPSTLL